MKKRLNWRLKLRDGVAFCWDRSKHRNDDLFGKKLGIYDIYIYKNCPGKYLVGLKIWTSWGSEQKIKNTLYDREVRNHF